MLIVIGRSLHVSRQIPQPHFTLLLKTTAEGNVKDPTGHVWKRRKSVRIVLPSLDLTNFDLYTPDYLFGRLLEYDLLCNVDEPWLYFELLYPDVLYSTYVCVEDENIQRILVSDVVAPKE